MERTDRGSLRQARTEARSCFCSCSPDSRTRLTGPSSPRARQLRLTECIDGDRHLVGLAHEPFDGEHRDVYGPEVEVRAADFLERRILHRAGGVEQTQVRTALLDAQRRALEILAHQCLRGRFHLEEPAMHDLFRLAGAPPE